MLEGYANRITYFVETKLQTQMNGSLRHDIECALSDYGRKCCEVSEREKAYWKELALKRS